MVGSSRCAQLVRSPAISRRRTAVYGVHDSRAGHIKHIAVGSNRAARDVLCHRSTLPAPTNKSLTDSTCVRCDPGSWRASSCHAQCSRMTYGGETTESGRSLLCASALSRADPVQVDRAAVAGRARAVICGTSEQQAVSAVATAHGVESQSAVHLCMVVKHNRCRSATHLRHSQGRRTRPGQRRRSTETVELLAHLCSSALQGCGRR